MKKEPAEIRFWRKVLKPKDAGCWEWMGSKDQNGYGTFGDGTRIVRAHRFSYTLHRGPIPNGKLICHSCDNPGCVNPDHLWLGTDADNVRDRDAKGRHRVHTGAEHYTHKRPELVRRGIMSPASKLSDANVMKIRCMSGTTSFKALGQIFGVSKTQIANIVTRRHWTHI